MVFMLVVMVTSLSLGGVASLTPRSTAVAAGDSDSDSSDTFKHSLTHLTQYRVFNYNLLKTFNRCVTALMSWAGKRWNLGKFMTNIRIFKQVFSRGVNNFRPFETMFFSKGNLGKKFWIFVSFFNHPETVFGGKNQTCLSIEPFDYHMYLYLEIQIK